MSGQNRNILSFHTSECDGKRISEGLYAAKYIAFFSVCCAHTYYQSFAGTPHFLNLLYQFGTFGVAVFFFISGYYFRKEKPLAFISKRTITIGIPWLFWGCAAYFARFVDNERFYFNPLEILRWLCGDGTYLWFLTVLICLQILFQLLPDRKSVLIVLIGVTILSRMATAGGLWTLLWGHNYNYYLNPLNWAGFFALGRVIAQTKTVLPRLFLYKGFILPFCLAVSIGCGLLDPVPTYAGWTNPLIQLLMIPVTLIVADSLHRWKASVRFGQYTLCLYLIHMVFIGKMNTIWQSSRLYALAKPVALTLGLSCLIYIGLKLSQKVGAEKVYCLLTGLKHQKD